MPRQLRREDYTVGWVCALPVELAAARMMLDEEHGDIEGDLSDNDENLYTLGSIGGHNVAIICLPPGRIGNNPAAAVAAQIRATFKGIRFGLMVGVGGGVPNAEVDVRLGDVVVSQPQQTFNGVIQYTMGKATLSGFERIGSLNSPPNILLAAVSKVRANEYRGRSKLREHISKLNRIPEFQRNKTGPDVLFEALYDHEGGQTCEQCSIDRQEVRQPRESEEVVVHYGTIASGNQVIRNAVERDKVSAELGHVLCFEMEAAGLNNNFPCLFIRGICDYADSHKSERWQPYAAGTAAAFAREVLSEIPPADEIIREKYGDSILNRLPYADDAPFNSYSKQYEPTCLPDTRVELLKEIYNWADGQDERCIFWLNGLAGTGKSTISRTVARRFFEEGRLGASFFFSGSGGDVSHASKFVTSIAVQLANNVPALRQYICDAIAEHRYIASESLYDQWHQLILYPLSKQNSNGYLSSYILVVDALNECNDDDSIRVIIHLLAEAQVLETVRLRVFLTSRPEIPIRHRFSQIPDARYQDFVLHNIPASIVGHDIRIFWEYNFNLIRRERALEAGWPGEHTIELLVQNASGLFIWAATACRFIREGLVADERLRTLLDGLNSKQLPEKILAEVDTEDRYIYYCHKCGRNSTLHIHEETAIEEWLSVSDDMPSLTTERTADSFSIGPGISNTRMSSVTRDDLSDTDSQVSVLRGVSEEDQEQITSGFTDAITTTLQSRNLKFSPSPIPQKRLRHVLTSKLKQYAKELAMDTPSTVGFKRKRNAAKTIFWRRENIAEQSLQKLLPSEVDQERVVWNIGSENLEPTFHDRIDLMDRVPADVLPDDWIQEHDGDLELYSKMKYELEEQSTRNAPDTSSIEIAEYLTCNEKFFALDSEFELLARHYCGDTMGLIQRQVLQHLSSRSTGKPFHFLLVEWDIRGFIDTQYNGELQDLGHMLAITGNCCDAQLTTVELYMNQTWPSYPDVLLRELQLAVLGKERSSVALHGLPAASENKLELLSIEDGLIMVKASGSHEFMYTMGQQLAWLGAVCRDSGYGLKYCDTVFHVENYIFRISYDLSSFDKDEIKPCWHRLIGDMVVATGFPIPNRPEGVKGLQIPIDIMATLGHVLVADDFGSGIILKGDVFDFFPADRDGDCIQWHLVDSAENALEYENGEGSNRLSLERFNGEAFDAAIAFLGWTRYVTNNAGSERIDFSKIQPSRAAQTSERTMSLSGVSLNFSRFVGAALTFTVGEKQYAQKVKELKNYDENLRDLRNRSVILYDTITQRGWLLDAERAALQILLHRCKTREVGKALDLSLSSEQLDIPGVMKRLRDTRLWDDLDVEKNEKKEVFFAGEVKGVRETLLKMAFKAQAEYQRLRSSRRLIGFEYREVVEYPHNLDPLMVDLKSSCGSWPEIAHHRLSATILFGRDFQEILIPKEDLGLCRRYRKMPDSMDYLAAEISFARALIRKTSLFIKGANSLFYTCSHPDDAAAHCSCNMVHAVEIRPGMVHDIPPDLNSTSGAIIIGQPVPSKLSRPRPERTPAAIPLLAVEASNLAHITIPSTPGTRIQVDQATDSPERQLGQRLGGIEQSYITVETLDGHSAASVAVRRHWDNIHPTQR